MYAALEIAKKIAVRAIIAHVSSMIIVDHGDKKISYEKWALIRERYLTVVDRHIKSATLISQSLEKSDYESVFRFIFSEIEKRFVAPPKKDSAGKVRSSFYDECTSKIRKTFPDYGNVDSFRFETVNGGTSLDSKSSKDPHGTFCNDAVAHLIRSVMAENKIRGVLDFSDESASVFHYKKSPMGANSAAWPVSDICIQLDLRYSSEFSAYGEEFIYAEFYQSLKDDSRVVNCSSFFSRSYENKSLLRAMAIYHRKVDEWLFNGKVAKSKSLLGKFLESLLGGDEEELISVLTATYPTSDDEVVAYVKYFERYLPDGESKERVLEEIKCYAIISFLDAIQAYLIYSGDERAKDVARAMAYPWTLVFDEPAYMYVIIRFSEKSSSRDCFYILVDESGAFPTFQGIDSIYDLVDQNSSDEKISVVCQRVFKNPLRFEGEISINRGGDFFIGDIYRTFAQDLSLFKQRFLINSSSARSCTSRGSKSFYNRFKGKALDDFSNILDSLGPCASVLVSGKPGTGKTLLCSTLSENSITLVIANSSFEHMTENSLRDMIEAHFPEYIIIDDISECAPTVFGKVLNMLDRLPHSMSWRYRKADKKLRLIMTCNNPGAIPENFKRPGRISLFMDFDKFISSDDQYVIDGINSIKAKFDIDFEIPEDKLEVLKDMYAKTSVSYVEQLFDRISNCGINYKLQDWDIHWSDLDSNLKARWNDLCD